MSQSTLDLLIVFVYAVLVMLPKNAGKPQRRQPAAGPLSVYWQALHRAMDRLQDPPQMRLVPIRIPHQSRPGYGVSRRTGAAAPAACRRQD